MRYGSHRYLGMTLDFLVKGKLKIRMDDYVKNMLEDFPIKFNKDSKQETPAANALMEAGKGKLLNAEYPQIFHTTVARGLMSLRELVWISIQQLLFLPQEFENLSLIGRSVFA
ncbi:unnamed protein product [Cylindrotheca closterium]|uniref:Uncharacterized protein n=1 Tax=Cylindrotheca closterium TaxID=2856 RepID=A0AAD2FR69_9STRA|nr:unnamed protein product [Cylindrotheca closterium]